MIRTDWPQSQSLADGYIDSHQPKILVVSRTFLPKEGGIEEYVYNRCLQDPHQIILLTASIPGDAEFDREQPFPIYRWNVPSFLRQGAIGGILRQLLYMVHSIIFALKLYDRYHYDAIEWGHGYDFPALLILSYLLPVRCFMYLHGNDLLCPQRNPLFKVCFRWLLNRVDGVICNSAFTCDYLRAHFQFNAATTYVINPAVRPSKFGGAKSIDQTNELRTSIRQRYQIPDDAIVIVSVGRLVRRKGFDRVIQQIPLLLSQGVNVHYIIGGRGAMETELRTLAERLGVSECVHFAGYIPDSEMAGYYAACDLFAMLTFFSDSEASIEGFGIVYLEAAYFGKPVLATRIGGVVDAVHHNQTGILVEPDSEEEITQALIQLCTDRVLRERLGKEGRRLAERDSPHRIIYQSSALVY